MFRRRVDNIMAWKEELTSLVRSQGEFVMFTLAQQLLRKVFISSPLDIG